MQKCISLIVGESVTKPENLAQALNELLKLYNGQVVKTDQDLKRGYNHWQILCTVPEERLINGQLPLALDVDLKKLAKLKRLEVYELTIF